jgi:hypothetical protein
MKRDTLTFTLNKFLACILISETLAVNTDNEMNELKFIREQINEMDSNAAERFGDWVDTFEHRVLSIADNETLFPILLMKAAINGRKFKDILLAKNPRIVFPFDDELRALQRKAEALNYNKQLYKLIEI